MNDDSVRPVCSTASAVPAIPEPAGQMERLRFFAVDPVNADSTDARFYCPEPVQNDE